VAGLALLLARWGAATYLGWELAWALPPIMLQAAVAADVFWQWRRLLAWAVVLPWIYLSASDALAIHAGIWAINPRASLGIALAGSLPLEEAVFFLLSTALVSGGLLAGLAQSARYQAAHAATGAAHLHLANDR
jgi:lycopene cyclase domain-containing protein